MEFRPARSESCNRGTLGTPGAGKVDSYDLHILIYLYFGFSTSWNSRSHRNCYRRPPVFARILMTTNSAGLSGAIPTTTLTIP